jgi:hypothetical protein
MYCVEMEILKLFPIFAGMSLSEPMSSSTTTSRIRQKSCNSNGSKPLHRICKYQKKVQNYFSQHPLYGNSIGGGEKITEAFFMAKIQVCLSQIWLENQMQMTFFTLQHLEIKRTRLKSHKVPNDFY